MHDPLAHVFWDVEWVHRISYVIPNMHIGRAVHVGSFAGDLKGINDVAVKVRQYGFEPTIVLELKDRQKQRAQLLYESQIMDKPKGCDIALATRMISDAAADLFDFCALFTSDADFLPAVEAVRSMGKSVFVFGYRRCLMKQSKYLYVPDGFFDLEEHLRSAWRENYNAIVSELRNMGLPEPFPEQELPSNLKEQSD